MGKSTPSAPAAPDPYATAAAQGTANKETAIANAWLGNVNETNPLGSVSYTPGESHQVGDMSVPTFNRVVSYSPEQQAILNQQQYNQYLLGNMAGQQATRVNDILATPFDPTKTAPNRADTPDGPSYSNAAAQPGLYGVSLAQGDFSGLDQLQKSVDLQRVGSDSGQLQRGLYLQNFDGSQLNGTTSGYGVQSLNGNVADSGAIQKSLGDNNYADQRKSVEDSLYSRLDPQLQKDQSALETRLVNQGFQRGSDAFKQEMDAFNRQSNDARMQVVTAGGAEQTRLAALAAQSGQFANSAQQQQYNQNSNNTQFGMQAAQGNTSQNAAAASFQNAAQAQRFGEYNTALGVNNANSAQQGKFYNDAVGQGFGMDVAAQTANNQAIAGEGQFKNAAISQQQQDYIAQLNNNNNTAVQQQQFNNAQNQQMYTNAMQGTQFNNAVQTDAFNSDMSRAAYQNASRAQGIQEAQAARNQPINEISALMAGSQVQPLQFQPYQYQPMAPAPIAESIYNSANIESKNYATQVAASSAASSGMFSLAGKIVGGLFGLSDRRLKTNIVDLGIKLTNGLKLYAYDFIFGGSGVGVMAQDVELVNPNAVITRYDGFKMVNYSEVVK